MRFNCILDSPSPEIGGGILKTDFKQVLKFFRVADDETLSDEDKANLIIRLFFDKMPDDPSQCWGIIERHITGPEERGGHGRKKQFDFNVDHGRVYASFRQAYGMDLREESMHWWLFLELFRGLPKETAIMETIELRGREIPKKGDPKYIAQLRRAKRAVALDSGFDDAAASKLRNLMFGA